MIPTPNISRADLSRGLRDVRRAMRGLFGGQVPCFDRCQAYGNTAGANGTRFTTTAAVHFWFGRNYARIACGDLRWVYGNFGLKVFSGSNDGEASVGNPFDIRAVVGLDVGANIFELRFGGRRWERLEDISSLTYDAITPIVISDPVGITVEAGDYINTITYVRVGTIGHFIPTSLTRAASPDGRTDGNLAVTGATTTTALPMYHPIAIIGTPVSGTIYSYSLRSDSIGMGVGDTVAGTATAAAEMGYWERSVATRPSLRVGASGAKYRDGAQNDAVSNVAPVLIGSCRVGVFQKGVNDINSSDTDSTIKTNMLSEIKRAVAHGLEYAMVLPIFPNTTTRDSGATVAGQNYTGTLTGAVTACTNATPAVATRNSHGLSSGDQIHCMGFGNVANGYYYVTVLTANTFELYTDSGRTLPYTSSGTFTSSTASIAGPVGILRESYRTAFNTYLRSATFTSDLAAMGISGELVDPAFEVNAAGTTTTNGGFWPASYSADGTHPNATGHADIATALDARMDVLEARGY